MKQNEIKLSEESAMRKSRMAGLDFMEARCLKEEFYPSEKIQKYIDYFIIKDDPKKKEVVDKINGVVLKLNNDICQDKSYFNQVLKHNKEFNDKATSFNLELDDSISLVKSGMGNVYNNRKSLGEECELLVIDAWNNEYGDIMPCYKELAGVNTGGDQYIKYLDSDELTNYFVTETKNFTYKTKKEFTYVVNDYDEYGYEAPIIYHNTGDYNNQCGICSPKTLDEQIIDYVEGDGKSDNRNIFSKLGIFFFSHHIEKDFALDFIIALPLCMSIYLTNPEKMVKWECNGGSENGNAVRCGFKVDNSWFPDDPEQFANILYNIAVKDYPKRLKEK